MDLRDTHYGAHWLLSVAQAWNKAHAWHSELRVEFLPAMKFSWCHLLWGFRFHWNRQQLWCRVINGHRCVSKSGKNNKTKQHYENFWWTVQMRLNHLIDTQQGNAIRLWLQTISSLFPGTASVGFPLNAAGAMSSSWIHLHANWLH